MVIGTQGASKTWHLPKELLTKSSPFFAAALNGNFQEAQSKVVNLPEDNIGAFESFVQWLYVGEITLDNCIHTGDDHDNHNCLDFTFQTLVQAWLLGDKLECPIFKDRAMLHLIKTASLLEIAPNDVRAAFEKSVSGSKLRKLFLDLIRYDTCHNALWGDADGWMTFARDCVDFGDDIMRATLENGDKTAKYPSEQKALSLEVLVLEDNGA